MPFFCSRSNLKDIKRTIENRLVFFVCIFVSLFFLISEPVSAATEFVSIIDPDDGQGTDYTSLYAWELAIDSDLTATTTKVFSFTNTNYTGTLVDGVMVVGQTSGATGTLLHLASSSAQVMIANISGKLFQSGEVISDGFGTTTLDDAGDSVIAVATCRSTNGTRDSLTGNLNIDDWTTSATNYIKIWTDPDDLYGRHHGVWNDNKYVLENVQGSGDYVFRIYEDYVRIDGLQIFVARNNWMRYTFGTEPSSLSTTNSGLHFSNNIVKGNLTGTVASAGVGGVVNLALNNGTAVYVYNNIIYDFSINNYTPCAIRNTYSSNVYIYNNTIYNTTCGIRTEQGEPRVVNNIVYAIGQSFVDEDSGGGDWGSGTGYNISSDGTAPGTGSMTTTTVSFIDAANNDFRLSPDDTNARDNGTSTPKAVIADTVYDIQGTARGGAWDIGADEVPVDFVSTICESTGAGGDCANLDYRTLFQWEDKVEAVLTASTTRVFSGSITGKLDENATVNLCNGSTDTNIDGAVVATTSDQIMIDGIIGTTTPLVTISGYRWVDEPCGSAVNYWTVSGTGDALGASPVAVAKIDGTWSAAETTAVTIQDWNTDIDNKIKIYTTITAQHNGKWDAGKYNLDFDNGEVLNIRESFVDVEGLQIDKIETSSGGNARAILIYVLDNEDSMINISKNIIKQGSGRSGNDSLAGIESNNSYANLNIYNNIFYGFAWTGDFSINLTTYNLAYIYNNTIYNSKGGISAGSGGTGLKQGIVINNLVASTTDPFAGTFHASSTHNATDISDTPSGASGTTTQNAVINFVSTTSGSEDFHLLFDNSAVKDTGYDLSSDPYLRVLDDIDGHTRPFNLVYDIGADEYALYTIYRSNGPGKTTAVDTDSSLTQTLSIASNGTATFSAAVADNVGVGDAIIYDINADNVLNGSDAIVFISARASSTQYTVQDEDGTTPDNTITDTDKWSIYRAYTSLFNAEAGTINTGISSLGITFDSWSGGRDLVTNAEQWNIACYANGTTADTNVILGGWTTSESNYLKIYTPNQETEVGLSQRHNGVWDDDKYHISDIDMSIIAVYVNNVLVEGLQVYTAKSSEHYAFRLYGDGVFSIYNSILKGNYYDSGTGLHTNSDCFGVVNAVGNIIYGFNLGIYSNYGSTNDKLMNNTITDCQNGIQSGTGDLLTNNLVQNSKNGFSGPFDSSSDYNISNITADAPNATFSTAAINVEFIDPYNKNFHLSPDDTAAIDAGTSTVIASVSEAIYDIDGNYRRQFDIGADEASIDHVGTIWASGNGDFTTLNAWEAGVQADLVATTTAVFSVTSDSGTFTKGNTYTGQSSGATATLEHKASTTDQVLLSNISGTFESGEVITDGSGTMTLADAGNPANAVARIDGAWSVHDTADVNIVGWTTGVNNYIRIYTTDTARHKGRWDDTKYVLEDNSSGNGIWTQNNNNAFYYIRIDGLQVFLNHSQTFRSAIYFTDHGHFYVSNCIIKGNNSTASQQGINYYETSASGGEAFMYFWNNIIYDFVADSSGSYPIQAYVLNGSINSRVYFYNNTAKGGKYGMYSNSSNSVSEFKNNIVEDSYEKDYNLTNSGPVSSNNISSDWTAPGTDSMTTTTVTFMDAANDDFRLSSTDIYAKNNGTTTPLSVLGNTMYDIQGTLRGANWDIGADEVTTEYVSTICETTGSGGDCADLDYRTLYQWEDKVESDLTLPSTRVFGGSLTGTLNEDDGITLYENSVPTSITATVVATTSDQILIDAINVGTASATYAVIVNGNLISVASSSYWKKTSAPANYWTVGGINGADTLGASPIVVAKIDGIWVNPEARSGSGALDLYGSVWGTDVDNNVRIYTTGSARHQGKWSDTAYRFEGTMTASSQGIIGVSNVRHLTIDGLQFEIVSASWTGGILLNIKPSTINNDYIISNNIFRDEFTGSTMAIRFGFFSEVKDAKVFNNIMYGFYGPISSGIYVYNSDDSVYIYNNTIYDANIGIRADGETRAINNILASTTNPFLGTFHASTTHNATDIADTPSGASGTTTQNAVINFVSTTSGSEDFHLLFDNSAVKDTGYDLSSDPYLRVLDDIDGHTRPFNLVYDIGADEYALYTIYRSNGPGKTTAVDTDSSLTQTLSIASNGTATFSAAVADNVGVGDAIIYDINADNVLNGSDAIVFISARASSTQYTVQDEDGTTPDNTITDTDKWSIYRAYTSLSNAEAGTINTGISSLGITFDSWSGGRDLVTNLEQWNIACYADAVDTTAVTVDGWTTSANNYLKIFTPYRATEIGVSQRHSGTWNENEYALKITTSGSGKAITIADHYVRVDGLQIKVTNFGGIFSNGPFGGTGQFLSNNIVWGEGPWTSARDGFSWVGTQGDVSVYNNIIYGFNYTGSYGINLDQFTKDIDPFIFNNTVYDCNYGIRSTSNYAYVSNNISVNNKTADYSGSVKTGSANNLSSDSTAPGLDPITNATVQFVDEYNKNFHLSPDDTAAIDAGTSTAEIAASLSLLAMTMDIDGHYRRQYDIGADEASIDHVGTIWESGNGDFTTLNAWEAGVQADLVATTTAVFSVTSDSGTFTKGNTYTGQSSGATATLEHKASTTDQVLLSNISGTFVSGEVVSDGFGTTTLQDAGNPANAVARIDGTWSTPDTTAVTIDGWTTGANNYIRIYTTETARHNGVWDDTKYRLQLSSQYNQIITLWEDFIHIDGLQVNNTGNRDAQSKGIRFYLNTYQYIGLVKISNNIVKAGGINTPASLSYGIYEELGLVSTIFSNNIIYGFYDGIHTGYKSSSVSTQIVGNTVLNNTNRGIYLSGNTTPYLSVVNNISYENGTDYSVGGLDYSANNISSDTTAPGTNSITEATVKFRDEANDDFRLSTEDTVARNAGTNARSVTSDLLYDIEGEERYDATWDIGADEGATVLYRSVGNDTRNLAPAGVTVTISSTTNTATFSATLDDNIGVGDVIQYGQAGYYKLAFIAARASSTQYTVHNRWGMNPIATTTASAKVYRVYEKLNDWNAHLVANIQPSLDDSVDDLALTDRNLIASNTAEFLPCYASTTPDDETINTTYANWTIGSSTNYIKIYTPINENEVGISQRHSGIWSDTAYRLVFNNEYFDLEMPYTIIDGVQVYNETGSVATPVAFDIKSYGVHGSVIRNSIIRGGDFTGSTQPRGIYSNSSLNTALTPMSIYNNIFYNYTKGTDGYAVYFSSGYGNMYNNTLYGNYYGVRINQSNSIIKNNVLFNNVNDIHTITNFTDYNASDDLDGDNPIDISPGLTESDGWYAAFTDYTNGDVSIRNIYSPLFDAGTTITVVTDDILGVARPYFDTYDIGAFEFTTAKPEFRFSPGGTFKVNGKVQFK